MSNFFDLIHCVSLELSEFLENGKTNSLTPIKKKLQHTSVLQTLTTITNLVSLLNVQLQEDLLLIFMYIFVYIYTLYIQMYIFVSFNKNSVVFAPIFPIRNKGFSNPIPTVVAFYCFLVLLQFCLSSFSVSVLQN